LPDKGLCRTATRGRDGSRVKRALQAFEGATGLSLTDNGGLRDELPPISTFLNRLLALTIDLQNTLFAVFEDLLTANIEGAITSARMIAASRR